MMYCMTAIQYNIVIDSCHYVAGRTTVIIQVERRKEKPLDMSHKILPLKLFGSKPQMSKDNKLENKFYNMVL